VVLGVKSRNVSLSTAPITSRFTHSTLQYGCGSLNVRMKYGTPWVKSRNVSLLTASITSYFTHSTPQSGYGSLDAWMKYVMLELKVAT